MLNIQGRELSPRRGGEVEGGGLAVLGLELRCDRRERLGGEHRVNTAEQPDVVPVYLVMSANKSTAMVSTYRWEMPSSCLSTLNK